ncbi:MAG: hypothetical protein K6G33_11435 [Ruminococcus sp.]|uniref:hypothetical protein n=1 Tax=Ruminococcus sp. TaxID=41978 RepID=UPI0025D4C809|nr:hypothetical protein [Ruminococcus sp.]MCR5601336.1 hypothetical protein [Ruminococcus sp.]
MKDKCLNCKEWHTIYLLAKAEFDRKLGYAIAVMIVCIVLAFIALIITALCVAKTQKFINQFEYVEETVVSQDGNGTNVAVIGDNNDVGKEY